MSRTRFHQGLDELKQRLLVMGGLAEQAVDRAVHAYLTRDVGICRKVLEDEKAINVCEREIDEMAIDLLAMQQPMAVDLRFLLSVIKINADLERVGDQAVNIAERGIDLAKFPVAELPVDIGRMASIAAGMVHQSLQAFIEENVILAQQVLERDDVVDAINREAFESLTHVMQDNPSLTRQALDALIVARNLERVADHATNIAEDVIFWVRGADVRHHGVS
ncbi:MAG TPA: phosphate signaling complex protein PhoU [Terriglobales bacterium]|nr:phosphate signaling complex protein PhoU [Terriglobales bacterium]